MDIELSKKYSSILTSDVRYNIVTGGRGSGKSFAINTLLCYMMMEQQRTILFLRKTLTSAHLSIIPEFLEKLDLLGVRDQFDVTKTEIVNKVNGSIIYFRGIQTSSNDNTANLKSINGVSIAIIDEAEELTDEKTFDRLDLSIRKKGVVNKVIVALNPCSKVHFLYSRFFESMGVDGGFNGQKDNVNYIHTTYLDNIENLDESFIQQAELLKQRNPDKYNHVLLGGWLNKSEGVIFENWELGEFKETELMRWGNDFGFSNDPTTLVHVSIDKKNETIYLKEELYRTRMTTDEVVTVINHRCGKDLVVADCAEPRLIDELNKKGLNVIPCVKGVSSIKEGIALLQNYKLIVDPNSINLIKELNNYAWSDKKSETPIDKFNHCFIGSTLISTINGQKQIKDIAVGDLVLTRNGYRKVLKKFNNGIKKVDKYLMQFDTFFVYLCSTKDHLIYTDKRWKKISELHKGMTIDFNSHLMEGYISYINQNVISQGVNGLKELKDYTLQCGSSTKELFLKDITFTTKTKTHGTTVSKISNVYHVKNILKNILIQSKKGLQQKRILNTFQKLGILQKNGMHQKMVENGIASMRRNVIGEIQTYQSKGVSNVKTSSNQQVIIMNSVQTNVNQNQGDCQELTTLKINAVHAERYSQKINTQKLKIASVHVVESWKEEVFDIMVDEDHEYFANGVLVHNCIDAIRYATTHALTKVEKDIWFGW